MSKSAIDAEVNNEIFRKDFSAIIALRRDLASIQPARLKFDSTGYLAGQCLARVTSTGQFGKWSAVSGLATDSPCVLFENVPSQDMGVSGTTALSGGALARVIVGGYVYKNKLLDYTGPTQLSGKEFTGADGVAVVSF